MTEELTTPLHAEHVAAGATLTSFAGWQMPLRYAGDLAEHHAVRTAAGLFDLSHMAQIEVSGPGAGAALDGALVSVPSQLADGRARYTVIVAEDGGIIDDLIVYRLSAEDYLVIANAANRVSVLDQLALRSQGQPCAVVDRTPHRALIAVQGPRAAEILAPLVDVDLTMLRYYASVQGRIDGVPALVARTGYTGEDGFELAVPAEGAAGLWRLLLGAGEAAGLVPAGLAARDTLRLEAGMPLYGQELTRATTPYEVGLDRLVKLDHDFVGRDALAARAAARSGTHLIGLVGSGRRAARAGSTVLSGSGGEGAAEIGVVTSGVLSPTLGHPIALARVDVPTAAGEQLDVDVRGTRQPMTVTELPFYRRPA
ncbi:glycine cleavage system aminomethyltransferase GcvT [Pseudactinotalea suaedae]|uniref:glycine cleavage system aminomethyltransferase GcvT n=1 Tax=Pseudactinotalea suaedae TaxID=1524924 RepID=UPI0012E238AD|nr:glycine cleavage system aminomethyltransferase GcvT [Pseudactinotalea suaedae]